MTTNVMLNEYFSEALGSVPGELYTVNDGGGSGSAVSSELWLVVAAGIFGGLFAAMYYMATRRRAKIMALHEQARLQRRDSIAVVKKTAMINGPPKYVVTNPSNPNDVIRSAAAVLGISISDFASRSPAAAGMEEELERVSVFESPDLGANPSQERARVRRSSFSGVSTKSVALPNGSSEVVALQSPAEAATYWTVSPLACGDSWQLMSPRRASSSFLEGARGIINAQHLGSNDVDEQASTQSSISAAVQLRDAEAAQHRSPSPPSDRKSESPAQSSFSHSHSAAVELRVAESVPHGGAPAPSGPSSDSMFFI